MFTQTSDNAPIRYFTARLVAPILPLLVCALMGLVLGSTETAQAQTDVEPTMPKVVVEEAPSAPTKALGIENAVWRAHFGEQAAELLGQHGQKVKETAMRNLITVATTGEAGIDLSAALPPLLQIAKRGATEERRLMALQAIQAIGTEHSPESLYRRAMEQIYRAKQEESSEDVRRAATDVLLDFYGDRKRVYGDNDQG